MRSEADGVKKETEGLLGKLQLAGTQRAETHAKALAKWEEEEAREGKGEKAGNIIPTY